MYIIMTIWISLTLLTSCSRKIEYNYWYGIYIPPPEKENKNEGNKNENNRGVQTSKRPRGKFYYE